MSAALRSTYNHHALNLLNTDTFKVQYYRIINNMAVIFAVRWAVEMVICFLTDRLSD